MIYKDGYEQGLYDKHADREEDILHLEKENAELKAKIEKMKCCENCKHYKFYNQITGFSCSKDNCNSKHSKWELAE